MERDVHTIDWAAVIIRSCVATAAAAKPNLGIVNGVAAVLPDVFTHFGILTARRQSHFISQSIIESDYFKTLTEYSSGDYLDQRTDLGFTAAKDGDGRTNKGFGIFQNTGPTNQRRALKKLLELGFAVTQDVKQARSVLTVPKYAAWAAGIFWGDNKLNAVADRDSTGSLMSRAINRGNANSKKAANHEADRKRAFKATWDELQNPRLLKGAPAAPVEEPAPLQAPTPQPWDAHRPVQMPGEPIDRTGMSPEDEHRLDVATEELREALARGGDMTPTLGQGRPGTAPDGSALNQGIEAPGQDPEERAEDIAEGKTPEAGPPSPSTPLPAEPVAPGTPGPLILASQERLRDRGFYGVGTPDGAPDWMTVQAISGFQAVAGLPVTGQLDQRTMDTLWAPDAPRAPVSFERAMTTKDDLKGKSRIVDDAEKVKTASIWQIAGGAITTATAAVVSGFSDSLDALGSVRQVLVDVPGWAWAVTAAVVVAAPAAYSYVKANRVQRARVEDYREGKTL